MVAAGLVTLTVPAHASLSEVGPIDPSHGYPSYFADADGVKLKYCVDPAEGCLSEIGPGPVSFPDNFPDEAFWFIAETAQANLRLYEAALEGAFLNEAVVDGDQHAFGRIRIRMTNLVVGATYHVVHPYGELDLTAFANGGDGVINYTDDQGCFSTPCDWQLAAGSFLGDASATSASWLKQTNAPAGTLGSATTAGTISGSPMNTNYVKITGPNAGGQGVDTLRVDTFNVVGVIDTTPSGAPSTPDLASASDSGWSDRDNITRATTPTFTGTVPAGTAEGTTVELLVDGALAGSAASAAGAYSITSAALAEGLHSVQARVANPAWLPPEDPAYDPTVPKYLVSGGLDIQIDLTAPTSVIGDPKPSNPTADTTPTFLFSGDEAGVTFQCSLKTGADLYAPCASPRTYDEQLAGLYTFKVKATDRAGNTGAPASYTFQIGESVPAAPTDVTATAGDTSATVQWTAPTGPVSSYRLQVRDIAANTSRMVYGIGGTAASTVVTGLTNGRSYDFRVRALNSTGVGPFSAQSNAVTPQGSATRPAKPLIGTAVSGVAGGAVTATANWSPPASDGGSAITGYRVTALRMSSTGTVLSRKTSALLAAGTRSLQMTLAAGNYRFTVRAYNAVGQSPLSARSNLVTAR